jgi:hypothetical protein
VGAELRHGKNRGLIPAPRPVPYQIPPRASVDWSWGPAVREQLPRAARYPEWANALGVIAKRRLLASGVYERVLQLNEITVFGLHDLLSPSLVEPLTVLRVYREDSLSGDLIDELLKRRPVYVTRRVIRTLLGIR